MPMWPLLLWALFWLALLKVAFLGSLAWSSHCLTILWPPLVGIWWAEELCRSLGAFIAVKAEWRCSFLRSSPRAAARLVLLLGLIGPSVGISLLSIGDQPSSTWQRGDELARSLAAREPDTQPEPNKTWLLSPLSKSRSRQYLVKVWPRQPFSKISVPDLELHAAFRRLFLPHH